MDAIYHAAHGKDENDGPSVCHSIPSLASVARGLATPGAAIEMRVLGSAESGVEREGKRGSKRVSTSKCLSTSNRLSTPMHKVGLRVNSTDKRGGGSQFKTHQGTHKAKQQARNEGNGHVKHQGGCDPEGMESISKKHLHLATKYVHLATNHLKDVRAKDVHVPNLERRRACLKVMAWKAKLDESCKLNEPSLPLLLTPVLPCTPPLPSPLPLLQTEVERSGREGQGGGQ
eukprot:CAMPEP_0179454938 /NCGR_PEP_ID=MMETSP0799-20121207/38924_1 /TAXON_ID=46947 /ORGANISM="Geminigera cryophila, Strain CCMP2564" /LENGTH=229 /DNA_ID=CAMNT_0021253561 /DNA_START=154 /DNA_END=843 /DNA_ORIENTATION=-